MANPHGADEGAFWRDARELEALDPGAYSRWMDKSYHSLRSFIAGARYREEQRRVCATLEARVPPANRK